MLIPLLVIHLMQERQKVAKAKFTRYNRLNERSDLPCFSVEDAIVQLRDNMKKNNIAIGQNFSSSKKI